MMQALLPVQLDGVWLGLDARSAREVLGAVQPVPLPRADPTLPAVIAWSGRAVAVVDLKVALGLGPASAASRARTVVCQRRGATFAVQVDAVREVVELDDARFQPPEVVRHAYAAGECQLDGVTVSHLDLDALLGALLKEPRR